MRTSDQIDQLASSLAEAQAEITASEKDRVANVPIKGGGSYSYSYATLASVWDCCREPLTKHGLSVLQSPEVFDITEEKAKGQNGEYTLTKAKVRVTTRLMHKGGQWCESEIVMPSDASTPQKIGSTITYARRYGLTAMVGVAPDDDDASDGSGVSAAIEQKRKPAKSAPQKTEKTEAPQPNYINELRNTLGTGCHCKTPEQAMAVLKFVLGDEWEKLPNDCTQAEAKTAWEELKTYGNETAPLHTVLELALTPR
jgi:hypothetical protein